MTNPEIQSSEVVSERERSESSHSFRKVLGASALVLATGGLLGAASGAYHAAFSPTDIQLGPHQATAQLTHDHTLTFDAGPIGSANKPAQWPLGTGLHVTIGEIPSLAKDASLGTAAGQVVTQYEELLSDPQHVEQAAQHTVKTRVWHDSIEGGGLGGISFLGLEAASFIAWSRMSTRRRQALSDAFTFEVNPKKIRRSLTVGAASLALLGSCTGSTYSNEPSSNADNMDSVLNGTALQGFQIKGELLQLAIYDVAPEILNYINRDSAFYKTVTKNFETAYAAKFTRMQLDHKNTIWVQNISDNHCNVGMDLLHGAVAKNFQVDLTIDSGDTTMSGTAAELECVSAEGDAIANPKVAIRGNHDSSTTEEQEAAHGFKVISDDKVTTIAGLTILGEGDPRQSVFGSSIHLRGSETIADLSKNLLKASCSAKPNILLVHDPDAAIATIKAGCASLSISGDTHVLNGPNLLNKSTQSYQFTEGTSGGAKPGLPTVGPLYQDAVETIFGFDKTTKKPIGYYIVTAHPDKTVSISNFHTMPTTVGKAPASNKSGD